MSFTIQFGLPKRSDFIVLYPDKADVIRQYLLDGEACTVIRVGEWCCLHPLILWMTLLRLTKLNWRYLRGSSGVVTPLLKQLYELHLLACLHYMGARAVLTFIDNSGVFQRLSRLDSRAEYFAIQNGGRTVWCAHDSLPPPPHPGAVVSMPNWFCYGQRDADLFRYYGHRIDEAIPVGSLLAGIYREHHPLDGEWDTDLCYISSWHHSYDHLDDYTGVVREQSSGYHEALQLLNAFLGRYLRERGRTLRVALREDNDDEENAYFRRQLGDEVIYVQGNRHESSTYRTMDRSRLSITINSTCGLDALSWGGMVLFFNPYRNKRLSYYFPRVGESIWYLEGDDYGAFRDRIDELLEMSDERYREVILEEAAYWVSPYDSSDPPHCKMKRVIVGKLERYTTKRRENS